MASGIADIKAALMKNRAKTGVLAALLGVALFLVIRTVFGSDPQNAAALSVDASAKNSEPMTADAEAEAAATAHELEETLHKSQELWQTLRTKRGLAPVDAFTLNAQYFNPDPAARPAVTPQDPVKPATTEERPAPRTEVAVDRAVVIREQARTLSLQSTYLGHPSYAVINAQIVHQGDRINGFRVTTIRENQVVLEKEGITLAVELAK